MQLARRLGVPQERFSGLEALQGPSLPKSDELFDVAFKAAPSSPESANLVLASALLASASETSEGRLASALSLMAQLVARADPMMTLGPDGSALRNEIMPNGWRHTAKSWKRTRYAWREGLAELLGVDNNDPIAHALDEVTRLSPSEPEPVAVAIQEQFPPPKIGFMFTILGLSFSFWGIIENRRREEQLRRELNAIKKQRRR